MCEMQLTEFNERGEILSHNVKLLKGFVLVACATNKSLINKLHY